MRSRSEEAIKSGIKVREPYYYMVGRYLGRECGYEDGKVGGPHDDPLPSFHNKLPQMQNWVSLWYGGADFP